MSALANALKDLKDGLSMEEIEAKYDKDVIEQVKICRL